MIGNRKLRELYMFVFFPSFWLISGFINCYHSPDIFPHKMQKKIVIMLAKWIRETFLQFEVLYCQCSNLQFSKRRWLNLIEDDDFVIFI